MRPITFIIWTEILRKYTIILGQVIALHDGIMGSFYCLFILFNIFKCFHDEHLLL